MPRTCGTGQVGAGHRNFLQCLFLLGALLHVRQPDEIQECAGGHDGVERLYGVDGVRV